MIEKLTIITLALIAVLAVGVAWINMQTAKTYKKSYESMLEDFRTLSKVCDDWQVLHKDMVTEVHKANQRTSDLLTRYGYDESGIKTGGPCYAKAPSVSLGGDGA